MVNLLMAIFVLLAGCFAVAAWVEVIKYRRERNEPFLLGMVTQPEGAGAGEKKTTTYFAILNTGAPARNVSCLLAVGDHYFTNPVGHGLLGHDQEARIETEMPPSPDQRAILMCRDLGQRVMVWDLKGNARTYKGSETDPVSDFETFWLDFYGEDLSSLTRVGSKVTV
jgi:hypothetical protein